MKRNDDISKELKDLAPVLATIERVNLYELEADYFDKNTAKIIELIEQSTFTEKLLAKLEKQEIYPAPAVLYFESFADQLITAIRDEEVAHELASVAPTLVATQRKQLYEVPATYFASFPETITHMAAREEQQHSSTIERWEERWVEMWQRFTSVFASPTYALAMSGVVGVIVFVSILFNHNSLSAEENIFAQMQQLPETEIHDYLSKHRDEFDERTLVHHINETEVEPASCLVRSGNPEAEAPLSENMID